MPDSAKPGSNVRVWGSDVIAATIREQGFPYVCLNPGASYRGVHDSLVNYLGNETPKMLVCLHEEHTLSIAQGYATVADRPLAAFVHSNVGLLHATMGVFDAWCARKPVVVGGSLDTVMAGLACGEVSELAWEILSAGANAAVALDDAYALDAVRLLARPAAGDPPIVAGETGGSGLAALLARAEVVVVANTGPMHLAAAVGTPVVAVFAPTVPASRWRPWGVRHRLLGDQSIECAGCRARLCPVVGHPCLASVAPEAVLGAMHELLEGEPAFVGSRR